MTRDIWTEVCHVGCWMFCGMFLFSMEEMKRLNLRCLSNNKMEHPSTATFKVAFGVPGWSGGTVNQQVLLATKTSGWYVSMQYRMLSNKLNLTWMSWLVRTCFASIAIQQRPKESFLCHSGFNNEAPIS